MQEYVICEKEDLVAMADAVREATGDVETYSVPELRDALINSYKNLSGGSMSEAQIIEIVEKYLNDNPIEAGANGYSIFYSDVESTYTEPQDGQITVNVFRIDKRDILNNERDIQIGDLIIFKGLSLGCVTSMDMHFVHGTLYASLKGVKGDDYVLTDADKQEIAELTAPLVDVPEGGSGAGIVISDSEPEDTSVLWIDPDDNEADNLQAVIDKALAEAKASGEFDGKDGQDGKDGYTPKKGIDYFDGKDGADGKDYVLTDADKQEIAELTAPLVEVPQGGGGTKRWTVLHEAELTEEATLLITDFDATLSEYVMQLIVPKVSATLNAGNSHFLGARAFTYDQPFGSTGYASHYTYHATILSGERMLMVKCENQANGTGFDNEYSTTSRPAKGSALSCNVARGIDIRCTFPVGTKVRLEGR